MIRIWLLDIKLLPSKSTQRAVLFAFALIQAWSVRLGKAEQRKGETQQASRFTEASQNQANKNNHSALSWSRTSTERPWLRFCVSGNAPLIGAPVVDQQGRLYFLSSDGYLHAFEEDGRYRFSYTVKGSPRGSLTLRKSDNAILLGTASSYLYAISQTGGRIFVRRTLSPVWSGITALSQQSVAFAGLDRRIYALHAQGGSRYRVKMPGSITGEMLVTRPGLVWVPLASGVARLEDSFKLKKVSLGQSIRRVLPLGNGVMAQGDEQLFILSDSGELIEEVDSVVAIGSLSRRRGFLVLKDGSLLALEPNHSSSQSVQKQLFHQYPRLQLSGYPLVYEENSELISFMPTVSGHLLATRGDKSYELKIANESLGAPIKGRNGLVYVSSASGRVCALNSHELP